MGGASVAGSLADLSRPDVILLSLPLLFVSIYGTGFLVAEAQRLSLGVAALLCGLLVADALFVHPPTDE